SQAVKSVGGHAHHLTGFDAIGYIRDHAHVRCLWIDLYDFRSQTTPPDQNLVAPVTPGTAQYPATQTIKNKPAWAQNLAFAADKSKPTTRLRSHGEELFLKSRIPQSRRREPYVHRARPGSPSSFDGDRDPSPALRDSGFRNTSVSPCLRGRCSCGLYP